MSDGKTKIRWSQSEYMLLAQGFISAYPLRRYDAIASIEALNFDSWELDSVQKIALPKERQRPSFLMASIRNGIFLAIIELRVLAKATKKKRAYSKESVIWSDDEWKQFAARLHFDNPDCHFLHSPGLDGLTTTLMGLACKFMASERQRKLPTLEAPRTRLLRIYADARATRDVLFFPKMELPKYVAPPPEPVHLTPKQVRIIRASAARRAPAPVIEEVRAFVINAHRPPEPALTAPPERVTNIATRVMESASAVIEQALQEVKPTLVPLIRWTENEWLQVAAELHHVYPRMRLLEGVDLRALSSNDVAMAQRVLPLERQRPNLRVVSFGANFFPRLTVAFEQLKRNIAAQSAPLPPFTPVKKGTNDDAVPQFSGIASAPVPVETAPVLAETAPVLPAPVVAGGVGAALNPYEAAFAPLVNLFGQQLCAQLSAQVAAQIAPLSAQIAALTAQLKLAMSPSAYGSIFQADKLRAITVATVAPAEVAPVSPVAPAPPSPTYATRQAPHRAPHIGILGNRNKYKNELEQAFPGIQFTCIDNARQIPSIANCDKAVAMTGWCGHSSVHALKKAAKERFSPIEGALSDLKRTIAIWIASGVIKMSQPAVFGESTSCAH